MRYIAILLFVVICAVPAGPSVHAAPGQQGIEAPTHVCPMHPDVRRSGPGSCPRCGMALVPIDPLASPDYRLELRTDPHPIGAGEPVRLTLSVRHPETEALVRDFAIVHQKRFHMFVISHDLEHYDHVHPEQNADGSWSLDLTVPRPGFYRIFGDFLPEGGSPQVIPLSLVTRGFTGDLASTGARLVPDAALTKTVGGMRVALALPRDGLVAGREERFTYRMADARTGAPVTDIEPYLGAWGHSLILSDDGQQFVHAHPVEELPKDPEAAEGGGPELTFKALLPRPGHYRVWTQFKRDGEVSTVVFTVSADSQAGL